MVLELKTKHHSVVCYLLLYFYFRKLFYTNWRDYPFGNKVIIQLVYTKKYLAYPPNKVVKRLNVLTIQQNSLQQGLLL